MHRIILLALALLTAVWAADQLDGGAGLDPDGWTMPQGDGGNVLDPDGITADSDGRAILDPNG
jgi:hypothetical protein